MYKKECSYCGQSWKERDGCCAYCGAPNKLNGIEKYTPFFYDGYIVYSIRDYSRRVFQFLFYTGITLKANIYIPEEQFMLLSPTEDYMPMVIKMAGLRA